MPLGNVHLTPQLVQAVRDAVDVVAIASEHTRLRKAGRRFSGLCPLHKEKTPSFSVDPVQGLFYCFGCGAGGDAIKLHMLLSGDDFPAAIESLAQRYGIPLPTRPATRDEGRGERDLAPVLEAAAEFFQEQLAVSATARGYLERRRIPPELVERFGLGYAPDAWRSLLGALHPRFPLAELEAAGLVGRPERGGDPYDRFRHRLVFPIRNASGRLVGFGGRTLGDDKAKYLNTAETERFHKGNLLYGLDLAKRPIRERGRTLLVEGYFDLLAAVAAGIDWAVAGMGTALTPEQARLLARYSEEVVVGYDGDEAGEAAARRALAILLGQGLAVRRARFGAGEDPDSLRLAEGEAEVSAAVERAEDAVGLELARLIPPAVHRSPRLRARAAREVAELLRPIPDSILRYSYGRQAADRLGVPVEILWKRLGVDRQVLARDAAAARSAPSLVRTLEDRALQLLVSGAVPAPRPEELPSEEAFLDRVRRNIFRTFLALYRDAGRPPEARELLAAIPEDGEAVDLLARLLLEGPFAAAPAELAGCLRRLERRWRRQRLRELTAEIGEAVREGDEERRERLLDEKTALSRALHGAGEGRQGPGQGETELRN